MLNAIPKSRKGYANLLRRCLGTAVLCWLTLAGPPLRTLSSAAAPAPVGGLYFRLDLNSIVPDSVTVPAGRYQFRLRNAVALRTTVSYSITRADGVKTLQSKLAKDVATGGSTMDLVKGQYTLDAGGRQAWHALITVTDPPAK